MRGSGPPGARRRSKSHGSARTIASAVASPSTGCRDRRSSAFASSGIGNVSGTP
ncbi:MAG TPA: hypothetical protein VMG14_08045 [Thermoplasmata archaeon]|nr:hypothetical protein [Thermoplasmata archaeon]